MSRALLLQADPWVGWGKVGSRLPTSPAAGSSPRQGSGLPAHTGARHSCSMRGSSSSQTFRGESTCQAAQLCPPCPGPWEPVLAPKTPGRRKGASQPLLPVQVCPPPGHPHGPGPWRTPDPGWQGLGEIWQGLQLSHTYQGLTYPSLRLMPPCCVGAGSPGGARPGITPTPTVSPEFLLSHPPLCLHLQGPLPTSLS